MLLCHNRYGLARCLSRLLHRCISVSSCQAHQHAVTGCKLCLCGSCQSHGSFTLHNPIGAQSVAAWLATRECLGLHNSVVQLCTKFHACAWCRGCRVARQALNPVQARVGLPGYRVADSRTLTFPGMPAAAVARVSCREKCEAIVNTKHLSQAACGACGTSNPPQGAAPCTTPLKSSAVPLTTGTRCDAGMPLTSIEPYVCARPQGRRTGLVWLQGFLLYHNPGSCRLVRRCSGL